MEQDRRYEIIDRHTDAVVGYAKTLSGALRSIDRRDNAYGACRYGYRHIKPTPVAA